MKQWFVLFRKELLEAWRNPESVIFKIKIAR